MKNLKIEMLSQTICNSKSLTHNSTVGNFSFLKNIEKKDLSSEEESSLKTAIISHNKFCLIDGKVVQVYEFQTHYDFYEIHGSWVVHSQQNKQGRWIFFEPEYLSDNEWCELAEFQEGNSLVDMKEFFCMDDAYQFYTNNK